jgi:hypothetical protein
MNDQRKPREDRDFLGGRSESEAWKRIALGEKFVQSMLGFFQPVYGHQPQLIIVKLQQCCNVKRVGIAHRPRLRICCPGDTCFEDPLRGDEVFLLFFQRPSSLR